jgi:hypothetical protein
MTGGPMDHEQFARRILGLPPNDSGIPLRTLDGVSAVRKRSCVGCGTPTDRITFDPDTGLPEAPRCERCAEADWDVRVELAP